MQQLFNDSTDFVYATRSTDKNEQVKETWVKRQGEISGGQQALK